MTDKDKIKELHAAIAADLAPQVETDEIRNRFGQHIKCALELLPETTHQELLKLLGVEDFVSGFTLSKRWSEGKNIPVYYRFCLFNLNSYLESLLNSYYLVSVFQIIRRHGKPSEQKIFPKQLNFL